MTIGHYDEAEVSYLEKKQLEGCPIYVQIRYVKCGSLDNSKLWDAIDHNGLGIVGDVNPPDGPVTPYAGAALEVTGNVQFQYGFRIVRTSLNSITVSEDQALLDIAMVTENLCNDCGNGYPGADQIIFVSAAPDAAATANVLASSDGGSTFVALSADPFAADESPGLLAYDWVDTNVIRLIAACTTTDAAALAKIAYADIVLGAYTTATWIPVVSTSSDGANGEVVTGMGWVSTDRLYLATDGGLIYVITNQGDSWSEDAISAPAVDIAGFSASPDGKVVWAFGATNNILREVGQNSVFAARVGPSGGGAFTALAVANDNTVYAGNGTSIYKSNNEAENVGGWTSLKDFGADHVVKKITCVGGEASRGGDSQILRVVVDDATPGAGEVWESVDGGSSWRQIAELTNGGYNAAASSEIDNNKMVIVGDVSGGLGVVHQLLPV
jgi:hypothetical protein